MNPTEAGDGSESPRPSGGTIGFALVLLVLGVIIVALLFSRPATPPPAGTGAPAVIPQAKVGATKHIGSAAAQIGIACLTSRVKLDDMLTAGRAGNLSRVSQDISDAAILHPGDGVRVLERFGPGGKYAKLDVVSGGSTGRVCFTEIDAPDFLN
jgi:hypothetical protein